MMRDVGNHDASTVFFLGERQRKPQPVKQVSASIQITMTRIVTSEKKYKHYRADKNTLQTQQHLFLRVIVLFVCLCLCSLIEFITFALKIGHREKIHSTNHRERSFRAGKIIHSSGWSISRFILHRLC